MGVGRFGEDWGSIGSPRGRYGGASVLFFVVKGSLRREKPGLFAMIAPVGLSGGQKGRSRDRAFMMAAIRVFTQVLAARVGTLGDSGEWRYLRSRKLSGTT